MRRVKKGMEKMCGVGGEGIVCVIKGEEEEEDDMEKMYVQRELKMRD